MGNGLRTLRLLGAVLMAGTCAACFENKPEELGSNAVLTSCERSMDDPPPAVNGAQCGVISVPIDEARPEQGTIDVFVKRWPSISAISEPDPVFVIAGGPGQSATQVSDSLSQAFFNLRKKRDIVFVDQRGTGDSSPMHCDGGEEDTLAVLHKDTREETLNLLRQCADEHRNLAPFVTTPYAIADLERVRQALGYQHVNLWGASYGTRVVLEYVRRHPTVVRSAVVDGLAPVELALPFTMAASANRALQKISQQCRQSSECSERYGDPERNAQRVAAQLSQQPVTLDIANPLTAQPQTVVLDVEKFSSLIRMLMYDRLASKVLPHLLASAAEGDFALLGETVSQLMSSNIFAQLAMGMHFSVVCSEDARIANAPSPETFLTVDLSDLMLEACNFWHKGQLPEDYYQPVRSEVPTLLLSGERDPVTPPVWAEKVAEHLSNAIVLVAPGAHHGVTVQGCGSALVTQFIRDLLLTEEKLACVNDIQPLAPYLKAQIAQDEEALP
ncbi:alpha/beta hydrolase [Gilvimarinus sp. SDUM040013]|uniref:Alpha/beta hydrolase n=1 Tax=Gilvimarinus gilvus TaxID=3058038 RepID=A0ABU4S103_9GAMM|nr:alpha/beta hydrolase [Gilvimarinus sp. SDUM040013]MDO3384695.1 alpha/beta hydrolase [Gilvimarinus sp. SDUM040013]MDX6850830.1 alpha/beta hydrolase [Gilvimarinus sp. SDUM040013]